RRVHARVAEAAEDERRGGEESRGDRVETRDQEMTGNEQTDRVIAMTDLVSVGEIGAAARKAKHGRRVTYGRVLTLENGVVGADLQVRAQEVQTGEIRITGT